MDRFINFLRAVSRSRAIVSYRSVRHDTGTMLVEICPSVLQDREPGPAYAAYHLGGGWIKVWAGHLDCSVFNIRDRFEDRVDLRWDDGISEASKAVHPFFLGDRFGVPPNEGFCCQCNFM